jgi:hypothetical protein
MDPTQCYLEMFTAMQEGDLVMARERALALREWLIKGGFSPPGYSPAKVRDYLNEVLRRTAELPETEDETP